MANDRVIATALHSEMQQSYLEYAMSVIVGRALPDARDGLKPVHRRIIYAMHELGLIPDRPYRKCARVVGDVLGKYHPHGDQAVYDALVRMVQSFSSRYPLLAGHGNFGSIDNDPAAAMRYTETRLSPVGNEALLTEVGEATVDFLPNFDNSQQEPVVLPAQLPILLLNGSSGIAVGMATNVPPHNLNEVVKGLIALIDRPDLSDEKLFEIIPGPDFPTGGEIVGTDGIREAYTSGRGSITVRGVVQTEEIQTGRTRRSTRTALIVSEFPYQVTKSSWIEKVAGLVNQGKIEGISDIRDESDREGIRVVIELKREANPRRVLGQLYKQTPLQHNFGAIFLALVDQQPRQLSLRQCLQEFLDFRERTLIRQYRNELEKTEDRLHLLEGLLTALSNLDDIIDILRNAPDGTTAKGEFKSRFNFSDAQANAILAMPMRRLTGLERQNLQAEFDELVQKRDRLRQLLDDRHELLKCLKKELRSLARKFGDDRRTKILDRAPTSGQKSGGSTSKSDAKSVLPLPPVEDREVVVELTQKGYVRLLSPSAWEKQKNTDLPTAIDPSEDFGIRSYSTRTQQDLLVLTRRGKAYSVKIADIPEASGRNAKGVPLVSLLPPSAIEGTDAIAACFCRADYPETEFLVLLSEAGRIKRLPLSECASMTARGVTVLKLKEDDRLLNAAVVKDKQDAIIATTGGRVLRFPVDDEQVPVLGRTAQGYQAVRLRKQEAIASFVLACPDDNLLLVSHLGYGKQLPTKSLRSARRGDIGVQAMRFANKDDRLVGVEVVQPKSELLLLTSRDRFLRLPFAAATVAKRDTTGDRLKGLSAKETVEEVSARSR